MGLDQIIIDGDEVTFESAMGAATVSVRPGKMIASGKATLNGKAVCISGDEKKVMVLNCDYTTSSHDLPGLGILKIQALASDQLASKSNDSNKPVILQGSQFDSVFQVILPAMDTSPMSSGAPPIPDPSPMYSGKGELSSSISKIKAT